jgi:hypothetical protein
LTSVDLGQVNVFAFGIVQSFLSCLYAMLFAAQLPWKGNRTAKDFLGALMNLAVAIIVSSSPFFFLVLCANLVAMSVAAGGIWLRRNKKAPCECFGVLSDELGKQSNAIGVVLIAANLLALVSAAVVSRAGAGPLATISPQVSSGALLFMTAFVWARAPQTKTPPGTQGRARPAGAFNPNEPVRVAVPPDMVLGHDQRNAPRTLASVRTADVPFGLLFVADGCEPCALLKRDLVALRKVVSMPLWFVNSIPGPATEPYLLHDADRTLRQLAGVAGTPCLLVLDAGDATIVRKVYGPEFIRSALLELVAKSQPAPSSTESIS